MASASVTSTATNGHSNGHSNGVTTANGNKGGKVGEHEEMQYLDLIRRIIDTGGVVAKLK